MVVDALENKIIQEFKYLLNKIEKGYYPSLEFILEEISALDVYKETDDLSMIQYYLWQES